MAVRPLRNPLAHHHLGAAAAWVWRHPKTVNYSSKIAISLMEQGFQSFIAYVTFMSLLNYRPGTVAPGAASKLGLIGFSTTVWGLAKGTVYPRGICQVRTSQKSSAEVRTS